MRSGISACIHDYWTGGTEVEAVADLSQSDQSLPHSREGWTHIFIPSVLLVVPTFRKTGRNPVVFWNRASINNTTRKGSRNENSLFPFNFFKKSFLSSACVSKTMSLILYCLDIVLTTYLLIHTAIRSLIIFIKSNRAGK